ncbi:MAG: response regulator [Xanthomonadales bacterium]|nr:response regulator [Xanthomonadales bacterium]
MTVQPQVLVIDDDADMRMLMGALLDHLGARVDVAGAAEEIDLVKLQSTDLILLDLVMPTGVYATCLQRLIDSGTRAKVCLLSGSSAQALSQECARIDACGLQTTQPITKPARVDALAALLATLDHAP